MCTMYACIMDNVHMHMLITIHSREFSPIKCKQMSCKINQTLVQLQYFVSHDTPKSIGRLIYNKLICSFLVKKVDPFSMCSIYV